MDFDIVVLGSINMDLVVKTQRSPDAGETLAGDDFRMVPGGKGANQAAAVGRLGGKVAMIGRTGENGFGDQLRQNLVSQGVDVSHVSAAPGSPTGVALIIVDQSGENRIIIVSGANSQVSIADVQAAEPLIRQAKMVLTQYEIPIETVEYAASLAARYKVPFVLNPAPYYPTSDELLRNVFALILNETEAAQMSGVRIAAVEGARQAAEELRRRGAQVVIVTLGPEGAVLAYDDQSLHVPSYRVKAVDTTAAGDAFICGFVVTYLETHALVRSVRFGNAAGAMTVTKFGAQTSLPYRAEVEIFKLTQPVEESPL